MKEGSVKSKRSDAHVGHAIYECRSKKSLHFSHRLMRDRVRVRFCATELRCDASGRKFLRRAPKRRTKVAGKKVIERTAQACQEKPDGRVSRRDASGNQRSRARR